MSLYQRQLAEMEHGLFGWGKKKPNTKPVNPDYQDPKFKEKTVSYESAKDYQMRLNRYLESIDQKIAEVEIQVTMDQRKLNENKAKLNQLKKDRIVAKSTFDKQYNKSTMVTVKR